MVEQQRPEESQDPFADLDLKGLFDDVAKGNFRSDLTRSHQPQEQSENELLYFGKSPSFFYC
ncbi:hypothetical protein A3B45_05020 [Candidatus Daviesbacteria bacterium RIFCSPLOWO2_01_FULL_39_12]|uniref:Uncharacterized protein n=1 Tax=Candidatus Daviesbacteria bacterium RIFCSPLOWO2_01_FULL_39_12 TaxID=1797785 RepID=A0A1F5KLH3_9BACT|nr:MAG: hypothetical protein A3B45_05020 [Candidatus Daviesbacteria bacterium RIFCSPLOWO2_01_FULL_39_12]